MSESTEKTISDYDNDDFEEEPIDEYIEKEDEVSHGSDNDSEISEHTDDASSSEELKGTLDDLTNSVADIEISSNTPSDFNSEDHAFHLDFITHSAPKLDLNSRKLKAGNRYNFSFSNERMREIERHNQILLQKILSKSQSCVSLTNQRCRLNNTVPPPPRVSSAAVNRKKQERQIYLDNQVLKRKIEQIAARRPRK